MMHLSTFNLLVSAVIVLVLYSVIDHHNKIYANIALAIVAALTSALLAILVYMGAVQTDSGVVVSDLPTAGILLLFAILIGMYSFFMAWDAKDEYEKEQEGL
jgi:exosome complex RNA-binding protein Rrp42 (RNase PH superfamily)